MTTSAAVKNRPKQDLAPQLQKLREIYAGAPELGRVALEKMMPELEVATRLAPKATINGRIGLRQGKVSEFTLMFKLKPGGADRLRLCSAYWAATSKKLTRSDPCTTCAS